jgi:hypothetical protein
MGYRFTLNKSGAWTVKFQQTALRNGNIAGFNGTLWHTMKLRMQNTTIEAFVDNTSLVSFADATQASGRAFLASTYNQNMFDNLLIGAPGVSIGPRTSLPEVFHSRPLSVIRYFASSGATIRYSCAGQGRATLAIYDMRGNKVRSLIDGMQTAGPHEAVWNGKDDRGRMAGNGGYLLRMVTDGTTTVLRILM